MPGTVPALAGSDWIADHGKAKVIAAVLNGMAGPVRVNGKDFNSVMPPWRHLNDGDVANVLTYVLNSWGNDRGRVSPAEVAAIRANSKVLTATF
jgi:nitrite reductase (NO-forming)